MNPDQEDYEELRRLLALKRHEQPPPGYFEHFSPQVISRIESGEQARAHGFWARFFREAAWAGRPWSQLGFKPVLAGALGLAACGLVMIGLASSGGNPGDASSAALVPQPIAGSIHLVNLNPPQQGTMDRVVASGLQLTNGMGFPSQGGSLFEQLRNLRQPGRWAYPEAADYITVPGGN